MFYDNVVHLLYSKFLLQILREGILVDENIHRLRADERIGAVPDSAVLACGSPRVLDHEIVGTVLILGHSEDLHSVVISGGLVFKAFLTGLLGHGSLLWQLGDNFLLLAGLADPTLLIRARGRLNIIEKHTDSISGEALLTHV